MRSAPEARSPCRSVSAKCRDAREVQAALAEYFPGTPVCVYPAIAVTKEDGPDPFRAVRFVLPCNESVPQLEAEMGRLLPLSMAWISRLNAFKAEDTR
jgi:hypothetical protein